MIVIQTDASVPPGGGVVSVITLKPAGMCREFRKLLFQCLFLLAIIFQIRVESKNLLADVLDLSGFHTLFHIVPLGWDGILEVVAKSELRIKFLLCHDKFCQLLGLAPRCSGAAVKKINSFMHLWCLFQIFFITLAVTPGVLVGSGNYELRIMN